jgi:hypothetical protein
MELGVEFSNSGPQAGLELFQAGTGRAGMICDERDSRKSLINKNLPGDAVIQSSSASNELYATKTGA